MKRTQVSSSTTKVTLKLLIDTSSERVLFAEAGKDFVDFLFGLLQLPVGAILSRLVEPGMGVSWSIGKVYNAVKSIDPLYFQTNQTKTSLLNPKCHTSTKIQSPLLLQFGSIWQASTPPSSRPSLFSSSPPSFSFPSPSSFSSSSPSSPFSSPLPQEPVVVDGYMKGMTTYMVMDDLTVEPMSTISSITTLNRFQVRDVSCLQEKTIEIDMAMALKLVKASFESTTVLTDVLLRTNQD